MCQSRPTGVAWRPDEARGRHRKLWSSSAEVSLRSDYKDEDDSLISGSGLMLSDQCDKDLSSAWDCTGSVHAYSSRFGPLTD
jgi:hypothetical protein